MLLAYVRHICHTDMGLPFKTRLEGWKEIAAYFGRTVRTVQRWERDQGLPVRRQVHSSLASAYAYTLELDAWRATRSPADEGFKSDDSSVETGDERLLTAMSRHYWFQRTRDGLEKSVALAKAALSRNPSYAPAHAALAKTLVTRASYGYFPPGNDIAPAREHAAKALSLDPTLVEAHQALGFIALYFDWDWTASYGAFTRALQLDRDDSTTHQWFTMWYVVHNDLDQALVLGRFAEALNPASPTVSAHVTWLLHMLGRFHEAAARSRGAIRRDRHFWRGYLSLSLALIACGETKAALEAIQIGSALNSQSVLDAVRAHALARLGDQAAAIATLESIRAQDQYLSPYWEAYAYAGMRDCDNAFDALERSVRSREWFLLFLNHEPGFDELRSDHRFDKIRSQVGLPPLQAERPRVGFPEDLRAIISGGIP